jgi:hypothetical protein
MGQDNHANLTTTVSLQNKFNTKESESNKLKIGKKLLKEKKIKKQTGKGRGFG